MSTVSNQFISCLVLFQSLSLCIKKSNHYFFQSYPELSIIIPLNIRFIVGKLSNMIMCVLYGFLDFYFCLLLDNELYICDVWTLTIRCINVTLYLSDSDWLHHGIRGYPKTIKPFHQKSQDEIIAKLCTMPTGSSAMHGGSLFCFTGLGLCFSALKLTDFIGTYEISLVKEQVNLKQKKKVLLKQEETLKSLFHIHFILVIFVVLFFSDIFKYLFYHNICTFFMF